MKHEPIHSKTWLLYISCCLMLLQHWETGLTALKWSFEKCQPFIEHYTKYPLVLQRSEFCKLSLMKSYWFPYMWVSILCCDMKSWNFFSKHFIPREEHMSIHLTVQPFKEKIGCCSLKQKKKSPLLSVDIDNPDDILPLVQQRTSHIKKCQWWDPVSQLALKFG